MRTRELCCSPVILGHALGTDALAYSLGTMVLKYAFQEYLELIWEYHRHEILVVRPSLVAVTIHFVCLSGYFFE